MGKMLLGIAAGIAACAAGPALAGGSGDSFGGGDRFVVNSNGFGGNHHDRRRNDEIGIWVNAGEWARYNNEPFKSDSFNGWWHDRPDRAYPAWMRNNQDCAKRWYSGSTLRC